jgi:hypothetical protein
VLPLLVANPSLITAQGQTRHTQKDGKRHPGNNRLRHIPRAALPFESLPNAPRRRVRLLLIQVRKPSAEIVVLDEFLLRRADVVAQDVRVEVAG